MERFDLGEFIAGLPEELGLECMTRLPYTAHRVASRVCRRWRELLRSKAFYYHRKQHGYTHKVACLVQAVNGPPSSSSSSSSSSPGEGGKLGGSPSFGITVFDSVSQTWERLDPVPKYPNGLPLFCQLASCEGKLVVMGGWDPVSYDQVTDVFVYDFTSRRWSQGKEMPSKRSFFAIGAIGGRVYVAGGHDESKNALRTAMAYDVDQDEWVELAQLSQERDECEGVVIGDEFWVVSGYGTESQGRFEGNAERYEPGTNRWRRVEQVWESGRCPRSCVGVGKDGKLVNFVELYTGVRVGTCGTTLGSRILLTGSEYQGAPQGFYMMEMKGEQNGKAVRIGVHEEFAGFVQSGCCVEI